MTLQQDLLSWSPPDYNASGKTFDEKKDRKRISRQCRAVWAVVKDGREYTLSMIAELTGEPEASISARLRDLNNKHNKPYTRRRDESTRGLWWYRFEPESAA